MKKQYSFTYKVRDVKILSAIELTKDQVRKIVLIMEEYIFLECRVNGKAVAKSIKEVVGNPITYASFKTRKSFFHQSKCKILVKLKI